jgi:hypothetical protein
METKSINKRRTLKKTSKPTRGTGKTFQKKDLILHIGTLASGKTFEWKEYINLFLGKAFNVGRVVVVCDNPDEYKVFRKKITIIKLGNIADWSIMISKIDFRNMNNGLLIFDCVLPQNIELLHKSISHKIINLQHYQVDIGMSFNSYRNIPLEIINNTSVVKLFETHRNMDYRQYWINPELMELAEHCTAYQQMIGEKFTYIDLKKQEISCLEEPFYYACKTMVEKHLKSFDLKGLKKLGRELLRLSKYYYNSK